MVHKYKVQERDSHQRLDVFLNSKLSCTSRSSIQKLIRRGKVRVNSVTVNKNSYTIKTEDEVEVDMGKVGSVERKITPSPIPLNIVYRDRDLLIVDKPSGLAVHPGSGHKDKTLINGLVYKFSKFKDVGSFPRFGLVHRLDKDTSGLLMVAMNDEALWYYSRLFEERKIHKFYIVGVLGDIRNTLGKRDKLTISNFIGRHPRLRKKMAIVGKEKGRLATTVFHYLDTNFDKKIGEISLLLAEPKTGRTHQIRVHLASCNYPIIGDVIYGKVKFDRMLLHAYAIGLKMLDGRKKIIYGSIPDSFRKLFNVDKISRKVEKLINENERSLGEIKEED